MKPICALALFILAFVLAAPQGRAQSPDDFEKASTPYEVGMIYYKIGAAKPNFEDWIKTDRNYLREESNKQAAMMMTEKVRLNRNYEELDIKNAYIKIRTTVEARLGKSKLGKPVLNITFAEPANKTVYFPYPVGDRTIAVIPNGLEIYQQIPLTKDQEAFLGSKLDPSGRTTMVLEIVPIVADLAKPTVMDGVPQWLLLGEIGYIGFYNNLMETVWSLQAPGYKRRGKADSTAGAVAIDILKIKP